MTVRRRKRKSAETNVTEFLKNQVVSKVINLMYNRQRLLAPFPLDPLELYYSFWTNAEREAINLLSHKEGLVNTAAWFYIRGIPAPEELAPHTGSKSITLYLLEPQPMPTQRYIPFENLPYSYQSKIAEWLPTYMLYHADTEKLKNKVVQVAAICSTYGQVMRLWPELQGFFGDVGRRIVDNSQVMSRLPDEVYMYEDMEAARRLGLRSRIIQEQFRPEAFAPFTEMIAECLMLPVTEERLVVSVN